MLENLATLSNARDVAHILSNQFETHANDLAVDHAHPNGREVWTKGIWKSFEGLRGHLGIENWTLYPEDMPVGPGRAKGEFLIDFFLYDRRFGPRIACESEISMDDRKVEWAFDKLSCVKSDLKILIFEKTFEEGLPSSICDITTRYLTNFVHLYEGEIFVLTQLDHSKSKHFVWQATHSGCHTAIDFKEMRCNRLDESQTTTRSSSPRSRFPSPHRKRWPSNRLAGLYRQRESGR